MNSSNKFKKVIDYFFEIFSSKNNTSITKVDIKAHIDTLHKIHNEINKIKSKECIMNYDEKTRMINQLENAMYQQEQTMSIIMASGNVEFK
jgi:predicted transcriptional regulator